MASDKINIALSAIREQSASKVTLSDGEKALGYEKALKKAVKRPHSLEPLKMNQESKREEETATWLKKLKVAKLSRTGYIPMWVEYGFKKKENQDTAMALYNFMGIKGFWIFGVFDGHGTNGAKVSNFVKDIIPEHIKSWFENIQTDPGKTADIPKSTNSYLRCNTEKFNNLEKLQSLKFREKVLDEVMTNTQNQLK